MPQKQYPEPQEYDPPVVFLLALGDPREMQSDGKWPDYPELCDLSLDDVPELVRMVQDDGLNWADSDSLEVWAPVHAWRALAQLGTEDAAAGLVASLHFIDDQDSDWMQNEMPQVFEMIGPASIPALRTYLLDKRNGLWARVTTTAALEEIGKNYDDGRDACISTLIDQLEHYKEEDEILNGFAVSALTALKAEEAKDLMEAAFGADKVDVSIHGDWEDIQVEMGWLEERLTPQPNYFLLEQERSQRKAAAAREREEQAKTKRRWAHKKAKKKKAKRKKKRRRR